MESTSPWNSPIEMVQKTSRDGIPKCRLYVDLRGTYPLPNKTDTLDSLGRCKMFTVLVIFTLTLLKKIGKRQILVPPGAFLY